MSALTISVTSPDGRRATGPAVVFTARTAGSTAPFAPVFNATSDAGGLVRVYARLVSSTDVRASVGTTLSPIVTIVVAPPPALTSLGSPSGPIAGGHNITVTGARLTGGTVTVGGVAAKVVSVNTAGTQMVMAVPAGEGDWRGRRHRLRPSGVSNSLSYHYTRA